jgi:hypothetical protein
MGNAIYVYESPEDAVSGTYLVNASAPNIVLSGEFRIDAIPEMDTPTPTSFPTVTITPSPSNTPLPTPSNTLVPTLAVTDTPIPTNTPEPSID